MKSNLFQFMESQILIRGPLTRKMRHLTHAYLKLT